MPVTKEDFRQVLEETLDDRMGIEGQLHQRHHAFIDALLEEREEKRLLKQKVTQRVIGWSVVGTVGALGYAAFEAIKRALH